MKRRHFFKSLGGVAGGLFLGCGEPAFPSVSDFNEAAAGMNKDEKFWKLLRSQFLLPKDYAYLNTGGLGSSPYLVINTIREKMAEEDTCPRAGHDKKDWWEIKMKCAALFGTGVKKEELALTGTATEGINIIINGLPLKRGDEIITSTHEHVALNVPLLNKHKSDGIIIKTFAPDLEDGKNNVKRIDRLITKRTRLIFTSHVTCTTGQVMPVKEIGELAKSNKIWFALDGVQAPGNIPVNISDAGADFYAVSGHKWILGPRRTGILYVRQDMLDILKPVTVGAYSTSTFDMEKRQIKLHPTAQRYEYGTQNEALFYGLGEAVDFISAIGIDTIREHNKKISEMFFHALKRLPGVEILSPGEEAYRTAMISFCVKGKDNRGICSTLEKKGLRVRSVTEANLNGIRVSFHVYNNEKECERLLKEIRVIAAGCAWEKARHA